MDSSNPAGEASAKVAGAEAAWMARVAKHRIDAIAGHCGSPARPLRLRPRSFIFLRHGETQGNHLRIFQHADIELNDTGLGQAREAAALLASTGVRRIHASTMRRAWNTAEIVGESLQCRPAQEDRLRERWFGDLVGTSSVDLDWSFDPPNGERLADFVNRTRTGAQAVLNSDAPTLLVAHGGTLYVLAYSLCVDLREEMVRNATPLLFERRGEAWSVRPLATLARGDNIGW